MIIIFEVKSYAQEPIMDFVPYCTFGVVTGALIGGASLALSDDPGSNLSPITKGASLGLYAGAAVGIYKYWTYNERKTRIDLGAKSKGEENNLSDKNKEVVSLKPEVYLVPDAKKISLLMNWNF